ncbi:polysaccharide pyruvyl transferase family protein [bacterium]|nr:polysaccharide pyruvyl transferase family protein [bacterium]
MKKILYIGIFSGTNLGDLVLSTQIYNYLKNESDFYVDFMDFRTLKRIKTPSTKFTTSPASSNYLTPKIKKIFSNIKPISRTYVKAAELLMQSGKHTIFDEYINIVDEYDIICIGGGNLLMSISTNIWAIKINRLIKVAKAKNKKVFICSVGAGPIVLEKSKELFKESLYLADCITVRDQCSKDTLTKELNLNKNIQVCGDPAILLNNYRMNHKVNKDSINIAVSVMPFGGKKFLNLDWYKDYTYYLNMYEQIIEFFSRRDNNYVFHLFSTELSDYDAIMELQSYVLSKCDTITEVNIKVVHINSLEELLNFYKTQDLLIGTRMHSLIIAYTQSLPIIGIVWQNKVYGFMKYIGLERYSFQLNMVSQNVSKIYNAAQQLLMNNDQHDDKQLLKLKNRFFCINNHFLQILKTEP